jgi:excinuclease ABC subunit A
MSGEIIIRGARLHNLKNVTVQIPKNKLVVLTGLSGSGKSALAFETLHKEGQRQYLESLGLVSYGVSRPPVDRRAPTGLRCADQPRAQSLPAPRRHRR